ncbi:Histidine protein methyltransferase 1 [Sparassis crispa]|uniref:protein-histidine N-methyltransferase n=1 Tax=Sparassis crispa TaxID=139825 RepID=A0A401H439_9APHY|nr:Histidine protein methyltransferase 1 [Sparassis crispa]GBE89149.1 Histidine protein methyltransferase 1 [Sparassis crispa]
MFKFNFDVDDDLDTDAPVAEEPGSASLPEQSRGLEDVPEKRFAEHPLLDLLSVLPPVISYSPLAVPLSSHRQLALARRDLFDARFQLILLGDEDPAGYAGGASELEFLDAPSDLVPGVYEGGLKTWECSLDLVDCLDSMHGSDYANSLRGKRILELGCGTALPTLYLLHQLFSSQPTPERPETHVHLQDYNDLVLRLVTLPNVILAWYMSPASASYRSSALSSNSDPEADQDPHPPADPTQLGELPLTPALTGAFRASLQEHKISLRFFSGSWGTFDLQAAGGSYDIILTSETIYRTDSLPSLVDLMWRACGGAGPTVDKADVQHEESADARPLEDLVSAQLSISPSAQYHCLVAAKLVYFGVGGGVSEFVHAVEDAPLSTRRERGAVQTVWERKQGVSRRVMRVVWGTTQ